MLALVTLPTLANDGLCRKHEQTIFSCLTRSSKYLSVCASKTSDPASAYLQYRFGTLKKTELEFPTRREHSFEQFRFSHYFRAQVDRTELSFRIGLFAYTVFSDYEGDFGKPEMTQGVRIERLNDEDDFSSEVLCRTPVTNNLSMLENKIPCDPNDNPMECPQ